MKGFRTIPPKKHYMTLAQIHETYGSDGVVAYSCKVTNDVPEGGFVIIIQETDTTDSKILIEYLRQVKLKYPDKDPMYYLRMETVEGSQEYELTYDNGTGEKKLTLKIEITGPPLQVVV